MKEVYINGLASISSQRTFEKDYFFEDVSLSTDTMVSAIEPDYSEFVSRSQARRMAKGVKMGLAASKMALLDATLESVDAIITGTGMGAIIDTEKFVSAIIDNQEEFLTPTSFIQSTHNVVAGQIALILQCKGYNTTYVHDALSFESALLDAQLLLQNNEATNILVGGVDELGKHIIQLYGLIGHIKTEGEPSLLESKTTAAVFSEGAHFYILSNEQSASTYAQLVDVQFFNTLKKNHLEQKIDNFLKEHALTVEDIDVLIMGNNGDVEFDGNYNQLSEGIFKDTPQVYYKHLVGEYNTVSAFSLWLASKILKTQSIPEIIKVNNSSRSNSDMKYIMSYNQYRGGNHSFILFKKC